MTETTHTETTHTETTHTETTSTFTFTLPLEKQIERLLILGTLSANYDTRVKGMTPTDSQFITDNIKSGHGDKILAITSEIYRDSRSPKVDNALNILAIIARSDDNQLRKKALSELGQLRTIAHLYLWKKFHSSIENSDGYRSKGFGRGVKRNINEWVLKHTPCELAYQITKYIGRDSWSFRDILRCTHLDTDSGDTREISYKKNHPKKYSTINPPTEMDLVLAYGVNGMEGLERIIQSNPNLEEILPSRYLKAVNQATKCTELDIDTLITLIYTYKLSREQIPNWALKNQQVWKALLLNCTKTQVTMPLTALLRNLGNMSAHDVFDEDLIIDTVCKHLCNPIVIEKSHIHPVTIMTAICAYKSGQSGYGHNSWDYNTTILQALEEMFYLSFKNVEPTGKKICFLIDCSGSMTCPSLCQNLSNAEAAALLAMIFARSETTGVDCPTHSFQLFTSKSIARRGSGTGLFDVSDKIDAHASFESVISVCQRSDWGTTDISGGILEALKFKRKYDAFVIITDCDVNSGIKPSEAMKQYREGLKIPNAKLAVVSTQGMPYTIADPDDINMMDMSGFDSHGPAILQNFIRGTN